MVVGILNTFAALASPTTLFFSVWRSIDCTPNAICGCWSMKRTCEFCGVRTSSFGLVMGRSLWLGASLTGDERVHAAPPRFACWSAECEDWEGRNRLHSGRARYDYGRTVLNLG